MPLINCPVSEGQISDQVAACCPSEHSMIPEGHSNPRSDYDSTRVAVTSPWTPISVPFMDLTRPIEKHRLLIAGLWVVSCLLLAGCDPDEPDSTIEAPAVVDENPVSTENAEETKSSGNEPSENTDQAMAGDEPDPVQETQGETDKNSLLVIEPNTPNPAPESLEDEGICVDKDAFNTPDETFRLQTLVNLYHGGNKTTKESREILCTKAKTLSQAQERYFTLEQSDLRDLSNWYPEDPIRYIVTRDTDGDGILDVRVKEYGAFLPNDLDADNDGIPNLMDARPLDGDSERDRVSANDSDGDGLPDHLDWSYIETIVDDDPNNDPDPLRFDFRGREKLVELQASAFNQFGVVLVEQDYPFSQPLVEMTLEVLEIFRPMMDTYQVGETLQSITMASKYGVNHLRVVAEVSPVNGQMILYGNTIEQVTKQNPTSIYTFAVYVHELTHVIQNAMDYSRNKQVLQEMNIHKNPTAFASVMKELGWAIKLDNENTLPVHGYLKHGEESFAPKAYYREVLFSEFKDICEGYWTEAKDTQWKKYNFPVCYATDSAREWHAEYVTATVLREMYAYIRDIYCMKKRPFTCDAATIEDKTQETGWENENDRYELVNANKEHMDLIAKQLNISENLLCRLSVKYAVAPALEIDLDPDQECKES